MVFLLFSLCSNGSDRVETISQRGAVFSHDVVASQLSDSAHQTAGVEGEKDRAYSGWLCCVRWGNTGSLAGCLIFMKCEKWPWQSEIVSSEQLDTYISARRSVYVNTDLCVRWKHNPLSGRQQRFKQAGFCWFALVLCYKLVLVRALGQTCFFLFSWAFFAASSLWLHSKDFTHTPPVWRYPKT